MNSRSGFSITPAHIAGLVVGEGCFYTESRPDEKYTLGWRIRPAFCMEMRADDIGALECVREQLGCGHIYHLDFGRYKGYADRSWHPHAKYRVTRLVDLYGKVVPYFRRHQLFGRKATAFGLFAEIVEGLYQRAHRTEQGLEEMRRLAQLLADHNVRGAVGKP
jgi:hypothetical protein